MKALPKINGFRISDKKAPKPVRQAYKSWADQRQRCNNPKDPRYRWWGAKGIQVEYSAYDFVCWWLKELEKNPTLKRPNCSRKDHSKNYSLDNIELLECSENSADARARNSTGTQITGVHLYECTSHQFKSSIEAHKFTGVAKSAILSQLKKPLERTIRCGWVFFKTPSLEKII